MKWIARVVIFTSALFLGLFVSALFRGPSGLSDCTFTIPPELIASAATFKTPLRAQNLLGTWKGTWGHDSGDCMLQIDRVEGNAFYGTLRKKGAVIRFEGIFNPNTRIFHFEETKVVRLGVGMSEWSLGKNSGTISQDGRILVGDGHDKWGQYGWAVSNY